jgi:hypothetical protein
MVPTALSLGRSIFAPELGFIEMAHKVCYALAALHLKRFFSKLLVRVTCLQHPPVRDAIFKQKELQRPWNKEQ